MALSPGVKERLEVVYDVAKTTFHWGFIPMVIYLGNGSNFWLAQKRIIQFYTVSI